MRAVEPMLRTWDFPATLRFYVDVLGFHCNSQSEEWASFQRDDVTLMFSGPNEHMSEEGPSLTGSLYFRVTDVDEMWRQLKGRAQLCYPIETFDYGMREFAVYDNNGYVLQFAAPVRATGLELSAS